MTIESIMYMGIGFLLAGLLGLAAMPLVHGRAVRLTTGRLEAALPQSMGEIDVDKDLLRAEFAMSKRDLENLVEQLRNKTTSQLVELGKKEDAINRLKIERDALSIEVIALKSRVEAAAYSTKMAEQAYLVPVEPTARQSMQEDTWTRDDRDASLVPIIGQSDTWARNESAGGGPVDRLDAAHRLANALSQHMP